MDEANQHLAEMVIELQGALVSAQNEIESLKREAAEKDAEVLKESDRLRERQKEETVKNDDLKARLRRSEKHRKYAEDKVVEMRTSHEAAKAKTGMMMAEGWAQTEVAVEYCSDMDLRRTAEIAREREAKSVEERKFLEDEMAVLIADMHKLEGVQHRCEEGEQRLSQTAARLTEMEGELNQKQEALSKALKEVDDLKEDLVARDAMLTIRSNKVAHADGLRQQAEAGRAMAEQTLTVAETQIEDLKARFEAMVREKEAEISVLRQSNKSAEECFERLKEKYKVANGALMDSLQLEKSLSEADIVSGSSLHTISIDDYKGLSKPKEFERLLRKKDAELAACQRLLKVIKNREDSVIETLAKRDEELKALQVEFEALQEKHRRADLESKERADAAHDFLAKRTEELKSLGNDYGALQETLRLSDLASKDRENAAINTLAKKDEELKSLRSEYSALQEKLRETDLASTKREEELKSLLIDYGTLQENLRLSDLASKKREDAAADALSKEEEELKSLRTEYGKLQEKLRLSDVASKEREDAATETLAKRERLLTSLRAENEALQEKVRLADLEREQLIREQRQVNQEQEQLNKEREQVFMEREQVSKGREDAATKTLAEREEELKPLHTKCESLQEKLCLATVAIQEREDAVAKREEEMKALRVECDELQQKIRVHLLTEDSNRKREETVMETLAKREEDLKSLWAEFEAMRKRLLLRHSNETTAAGPPIESNDYERKVMIGSPPPPPPPPHQETSPEPPSPRPVSCDGDESHLPPSSSSSSTTTSSSMASAGVTTTLSHTSHGTNRPESEPSPSLKPHLPSSTSNSHSPQNGPILLSPHGPTDHHHLLCQQDAMSLCAESHTLLPPPHCFPCDEASLKKKLSDPSMQDEGRLQCTVEFFKEGLAASALMRLRVAPDDTVKEEVSDAEALMDLVIRKRLEIVRWHSGGEEDEGANNLQNEGDVEVGTVNVSEEERQPFFSSSTTGERVEEQEEEGMGEKTAAERRRIRKKEDEKHATDVPKDILNDEEFKPPSDNSDSDTDMSSSSARVRISSRTRSHFSASAGQPPRKPRRTYPRRVKPLSLSLEDETSPPDVSPPRQRRRTRRRTKSSSSSLKRDSRHLISEVGGEEDEEEEQHEEPAVAPANQKLRKLTVDVTSSQHLSISDQSHDPSAATGGGPKSPVTPSSKKRKKALANGGGTSFSLMTSRQLDLERMKRREKEKPPRDPSLSSE